MSQNEDVGVSQIQADRWEWSKFLQETALWCNGHPNLGRHKFGTTQTWTRNVYFQLNMFESLLVHTTSKLMPIVRPVMLVASSWKLELDLVGTGANLARISIDILGTKRHPQANAMLLIQYFFLAHRAIETYLVETISSVTGTAIHRTELALVSLMINTTWLPQYEI